MKARTILLMTLLVAACHTGESPDLNRPETIEDVLGPINIPEDQEVVAEAEPEPEPTPEPAPTAVADSSSAGAPAQTITFDGVDADPTPTDKVKTQPPRPTLPSLELFGAGGRGGPGQR
ncbi:MAG: hypothetical protein R3A51_16565 [Nannocystaceae bacterium]